MSPYRQLIYVVLHVFLLSFPPNSSQKYVTILGDEKRKINALWPNIPLTQPTSLGSSPQLEVARECKLLPQDLYCFVLYAKAVSHDTK